MEPVFILVRPQLGENIGSSARAMLNFGLTNLRIVKPRDGWPNPRAKALASGAGSVLDNAIVYENVKDSCVDLNYVFASSARERKLDKEEIPLESSLSECQKYFDQGLKVGFLFGPEQSGLSNNDMAFADKIVFLNTADSFSSINLSQCVMLFAYEWFKTRRRGAQRNRDKFFYPLAKKEEMNELLMRLNSSLQDSGFFWPKDKEKSLKLYIDNLFSKLPLNSSDIRFMHGIVRSLSNKKQNKP